MFLYIKSWQVTTSVSLTILIWTDGSNKISLHVIAEILHEFIIIKCLAQGLTHKISININSSLWWHSIHSTNINCYFSSPILDVNTQKASYYIKFHIFTVCLRGTKVHRKCYLASEGLKHFHEANEDCISKGGTLVIPRNSDEINALRDYGKRSLPGINDFWLGINDMVTEGKFVDVHGVTISFLNWDRAQPNGGKRENCALFSQSAQGKWSDEVCRSSKRYICEFIIP